MLFKIGICLYWLLSVCVTGFNIQRIEPTTVYRDYSQKIDFSNYYVTTTETNTPLSILTDKIFPHDRLPFSFSQMRCKTNQGFLVQTIEMQERYVLSCCSQINKTMHKCPRPPLGEINLIENIFLIEKRDVYFAPVSNTSTWKKSSVSVTYQYNNPIEGIIRVFIGIGVIVFVLCCGLHLLVGGLHKWSNSHPGICILTHNFMSLSLSILISTLLNEENDPLYRFGLLHTLLQVVFSIVLVYVPSDGIATQDQRIDVSSSSFISKIGNSPYSKWVAVHILAMTSVFNIVSLYTVFHILWDRFDSTFDVLFIASLGYLLMLLIFMISFLTAIYDIHNPLRVNSESVILNTKGISPQKLESTVMYDYKTKTFKNEVIFEENMVVAAYSFNNHFILYNIGVFDDGQIILNEYVYGGHIKCSNTFKVNLPKECKETSIIVYSIDKQLSLFKIGCLKRKGDIFHMHLFHTYTLRFFQFLLKIAPVYDDSDGSYKINVVENLRSFAQDKINSIKLCRRKPYIVSILYLCVFFAIFIWSVCLLVENILIDSSLWYMYVVESIFLLSLSIFAAHVSTRKKMKMTERISNKRGTSSLQVFAGDETEYFSNTDEVFLQILAKSSVPSICFVKIFTEDNTNLVNMLWPAQCPKRHNLLLSKTNNASWVCDQCQTILQNESSIWVCNECNYCQCPVCAPILRVFYKNKKLHLCVDNSCYTKLLEDTGSKWNVRINL